MATIAATLDSTTAQNLENLMNATARTIRKVAAAEKKATATAAAVKTATESIVEKAAKGKATRLPRAKVVTALTADQRVKLAAAAKKVAGARSAEAFAITDPKRVAGAAKKATEAANTANLRASEAGLELPFDDDDLHALFDLENGMVDEVADGMPSEDDVPWELDSRSDDEPKDEPLSMPLAKDETVKSLTTRQRALMLAIGQQKFSFFDGGIVADEGIWHAQLTDEASGKGSLVATTPHGVANVIAALGRKGLLTISDEQGMNDGADIWVSLTESGAALANSLAATAPAPTPTKKGATAKATTKPAAKVTPAPAKPVAKPVTKAAAKKASKAEVAADPSRHPKVVALAEYATAMGWVTEVNVDAPNVVVVSERDAERLTTTFIDGKLDLALMPTYVRADGSTVLLRNVSAVKKQMDADPAARPVKAERSVAKRSAKKDEDGTPQRSLPFDPAETSNEDIAEIIAGTVVRWRRSDGAIDEAVAGKKVIVADHPRKPGKVNRIVRFWSMVESDKHGMIAGPERTVGLSALLTVGK